MVPTMSSDKFHRSIELMVWFEIGVARTARGACVVRVGVGAASRGEARVCVQTRALEP